MSLRNRGGVKLADTITAPGYRLYALPGTVPPKPGLICEPAFEGPGIAVEVWALPAAAFRGHGCGYSRALGHWQGHTGGWQRSQRLSLRAARARGRRGYHCLRWLARLSRGKWIKTQGQCGYGQVDRRIGLIPVAQSASGFGAARAIMPRPRRLAGWRWCRRHPPIRPYPGSADLGPDPPRASAHSPK
jgi:hypothetical protein